MNRQGQPAKQLARALGQSTTRGFTRRLERLGGAGLLGPHVQVGRGQSEGSASHYRPGIVARAREALSLSAEHGALDLAALVMFVRGWEFEKEKLDAAYTSALGRFEAAIERHGGEGSDYDRADRVAEKLARAAAKSRGQADLRGRLRDLNRSDRSESTRWLLRSFFHDAVHIMMRGRATSDQGLLELMHGNGISQVTMERLPDRPPPIPTLPLRELKHLVSLTSLGGVARIVGRATYAELELARDDVVALVTFARSFAPFVQRVYGLRYAFGFTVLASLTELGMAFAVPGLVILRPMFPTELEELRATIAREQPRFDAMNALADRIPARYYPLHATYERYTTLSEAEQHELKTIIDRFELERPADYAQIMAAAEPESE
jgi:hypothetical protein